MNQQQQQHCTRSAVDFDKQIPREPFVDPKKGPNEKRFELIKTPKILSSYHEPHPPQFKNSKGRESNEKKESYFMDYDVNLNSIARSLGRQVPAFEKFIKRKDPAIEKSFIVPECYPQNEIEKGEKALSNFTK